MGNSEKLIVEVVAAHNLMPKDGHGSSSPLVEVQFEGQKRRTAAIPKNLNPVWNECLVFSISDTGDLPYRSIDVAVYNDHSSATAGRNFLGKVRIPAAGVPAPGEHAFPQLFPLEKRSLFSHIRGEISLKIYRASAIGGRGLQLAKSKSNLSQEKQPPVAPMEVSPTRSAMKPAEPVSSRPSAETPLPESGKPNVLAAAPPQMQTHNGEEDFALKETRPRLGGEGFSSDRDRTSRTYDLVEQMRYLYVRVVRARELGTAAAGETRVEVKLGNYRGVTRPSAAQHWDQSFAFSSDTIQSSTVEIIVKERVDDFIGRLGFDLSEVPRRVPPDSTLAPQWYRLDDRNGVKGKAEIMVSVWFGTQADEAFSESWHSRATGVNSDMLGSIKSKVYVAPKLWYLRVSVIEAQDLLPGEKGAALLGRFPELSVKAQIGNHVLRTPTAAVMQSRNPSSPFWNEDLLFVVAEPFDEHLLVTVEDRLGHGHSEPLGRVVIPISAVERRLNEQPAVSRWFGLERLTVQGVARLVSRVHLGLCLEGGYHVLDEMTMYSSDLRPPAKQLWMPHIGVLELGILCATGLVPAKLREAKGGTTDAYCVAKYGQKWIRTRTVIDSFSPKWNEQYTWEVFDPCTVITIGVFDNSLNGSGDVRIGKVRIRLSTLQTDRVYSHMYPLLTLHTAGLKKMGDLHLAIRFSCANAGNMLQSYMRPLLPKMHYLEPLLVRQVENLRYQATNVVAARLGRAEPPLGREVVECMLDHGSHLWSMRKSRANFFRLVAVLSTPIAVGRWADSIRSWKRPVISALISSAVLMFVIFPGMILPAVFCGIAMAGLWNYRSRPKNPPHMDARMSSAEAIYGDELDEELDSFPTSRSAEVVRMRYDRLRSVAGRVQTVVGDLGTQGERAQALLSWRDQRATFLFVLFCIAAAVVFYVVPVRAVAAGLVVYVLRPPRFRSRLPSPLMNFFRRLPAKADCLL
ncbi:hypothetical protein KSP39_PZI014844 [Platanthera zijinensis]|uniref:C2 domain-containing protein n=1 Tax=Platanthera zijinensis TaxID=2320716 RepID=A0AAP0BBQ7_9ASPA